MILCQGVPVKLHFDVFFCGPWQENRWFFVKVYQLSYILMWFSIDLDKKTGDSLSRWPVKLHFDVVFCGPWQEISEFFVKVWQLHILLQVSPGILIGPGGWRILLNDVSTMLDMTSANWYISPLYFLLEVVLDHHAHAMIANPMKICRHLTSPSSNFPIIKLPHYLTIPSSNFPII